MAGGPVSRDISGASGRVGEGNENLFCLSVHMGLAEIFYMPKNLTTWDLPLYLPYEGRCAADFYPL
jgi:hypothetical protein